MSTSSKDFSNKKLRLAIDAGVAGHDVSSTSKSSLYGDGRRDDIINSNNNTNNCMVYSAKNDSDRAVRSVGCFFEALRKLPAIYAKSVTFPSE
jgi:hypothetical protein